MHAKSQKLLHHQVSLHSCHSKDLRGEWTWSTHWNNDCINTFLSFIQRVNIVNWTEETGDTNGFTSTSVKSSFKPSVSWSKVNKTYQIVRRYPKTYHNSARVPTLPVHTEFHYILACFHMQDQAKRVWKGGCFSFQYLQSLMLDSNKFIQIRLQDLLPGLLQLSATGHLDLASVWHRAGLSTLTQCQLSRV